MYLNSLLLLGQSDIEIPSNEIDTRLVGLTVTISGSTLYATHPSEKVVTVTREILRTHHARCNTWCAWDMKSFTSGSLRIYVDDMTYMLWLSRWEE